VVAAPAVAVLAHAVLAAAGFVLLLVAQIEQSRELRVGDRHHVAAVAAVAAAARHELLAAKAHAAAPAVAGDNANLDLVDKLHGKSSAGLLPGNYRSR